MTKAITAITLFILFALALTSIFLWAAFDVRWWTEDSVGGRSMILMMLHVSTLMAFPFYRIGQS